MTALCIPAEADRGRDGWHVVWRKQWQRNTLIDTPTTAQWTRPPGEHGEWRWVFEGRGEIGDAADLAASGWRYGGPAPKAKESEG